MPSDYEQIRNDNLREYGQGTRHLSFLGRLYTDRTHFILEILQNAEDARATRVSFELSSDKLEIRHDGRPFDEEDVRGISGVGEGTKEEDLTKIGKFGIGFKSVYAYTSSPEIHSGDEHFRIEHYVRPCHAARQVINSPWTTLFILPFDNYSKIEPNKAFREIGERLKTLGPRTLLFLRHIDRIEWAVHAGPRGFYQRNEKKIGSAREVTVFSNSVSDGHERWLVFERTLMLQGASDPIRVEVAYKILEDEKTSQKYISRVKESLLVAFFPTEKPTPFGFLIQGPYRTTPSRDNVPKDDEVNRLLINSTASLITDTLQQLKELGFISVSLLQAMPIRTDGLPDDGMFQPIVDAVRRTLMEQALLPADDGNYVSARNAKLASADWLRKLLSGKQLGELLGYDGPLKWVTGEITERRTIDLWRYLRDTLGIEEIDPDKFAARISAQFLEKQPDEWISSFYSYLIGQEALWRPPRSRWDSAGPLRGRPFIRLENGKHVTPFREDGSARVYLPAPGITGLPTVKRGIAADPQSLEFLKKLGIPEFDIVAEVLEIVVKKYKNVDVGAAFDIEMHLGDIEKIRQALKTDSLEKKQRLTVDLRETPFIRAVNAASNQPGVKKPSEIYLRSPDLELYFEGNQTVWFLDSLYDEHCVQCFAQLGISRNVRVSCRSSDQQGHVIISKSHGWHRRGLNGFDPDCEIDGLSHALDQRTKEKSVFIWNELVLSNAKNIMGIVESSTRQTYETSEKVEKISKMGVLLRGKRWLPNRCGIFSKPADLSIDDLSPEFERNDRVARLLGMKLNEAALLARRMGIDLEDIEILKRYREAFESWKRSVLDSENNQREFPSETSRDKDRRREKVLEGLDAAPDKTYEKREHSVRTTSTMIAASVWLRNKYTKHGEMFCQICREVMPFKKRDGDYYFEAVEILKDISKEHDALHLALCPVCAAKYKEFVKRDLEEMEKVKRAIVETKTLEISLHLDTSDRSISFVETHLDDLKTILEELGVPKDTSTSKPGPTSPVMISQQTNNSALPQGEKPKTQDPARPKTTDPPTQNVPAPRTDLITCPICGVKVSPARMERHKSRVHKTAYSLAARASSVSACRTISRAVTKPSSHSAPTPNPTHTSGSSGLRRCRFCGNPAVPGSDTCYSCG